MTAAYVPVKGDRVRRPAWSDAEYFLVLNVARNTFHCVDADGGEWSITLDGEWVKVETPTPLPELWINAYPDSYIRAHDTSTEAQRHALDNRIALVHIWTDADGVDRIERVTA